MLNLVGVTVASWCDGHVGPPPPTNERLVPRITLGYNRHISPGAQQKHQVWRSLLEKSIGQSRNVRLRQLRRVTALRAELDAALAMVVAQSLNLLQEFYRDRQPSEAARIVINHSVLISQGQLTLVSMSDSDRAAAHRAALDEFHYFEAFLRKKFLS